MPRTLIVVDLQVDFCPGGRLAVAGGDEIVAPINRLMADFDHVILTQDWHPADHASFADNHPGAQPYSLAQMTYGPQVLWPAHCVIGSAGAGFHPDLDVSRAEAIIRKGFRRDIDSYSAFFENDYRTPTGLAGYLRERGLEELHFAGLAWDFCVAWSAVDAVRQGFDVTVIEDATRAIDLNGSRVGAGHEMRRAGVRIA
jgi:nicotinamidase/pyrazinamidase